MKRIRNFAKRCFGLTMAALMTVSALAGCGKSQSGTLVEQALNSSKDYVFKRALIDFPGNVGIFSVGPVGDGVGTMTYAPEKGFNIYTVNSDGSDLKSFTMSEEENVNYIIRSFDKEGNLYAVRMTYHYDDPMAETDYDEELVKFDTSGSEVLTIDLIKEFPDADYLSINGLTKTDIGLLLSTNFGLYKVDEAAGSLEMLVDYAAVGSPFDDNMVNIFVGESGSIYAYLITDGPNEVRLYDPDKKTFGDALPQFKDVTRSFYLFSGKGYELYACEEDGFYGFDPKKNSLDKILDFDDSDIELTYPISEVVAISKDEFIAALPDENYNTKLYKLTKIPPSEVKDKKIITLAGFYIDFSIRSLVYQFNDTNDEYKIKVVDYSKLSTEDDYNAGANQFNLDIVSGNTPDIMYFSGEDAIESYINKGLFLDLTPYLDKDPDYSQESFVQSAFNAYKTDGKQYVAIPSFVVQTVAIKTANLKGAETLSIQDIRDIVQAKGIKYLYAFGPSKRSTILETGLASYNDIFVDWESKTCNFNSDEFKEFLAFVKEFPEEIPDDVWENYKDTTYRTDDAILYDTYLNNFREFTRLSQGAFGEDISLIGFPNNSGKNCSAVYSSNILAVSSKSQYPDACWDFLRTLYSDEFQAKLNYNFPITQKYFDQMASDSMGKYFELDDEGNKVYTDDTYYIGDSEIVLKPLTQSEVDYLEDFIYSVDDVYSINKNIYNIITEEAEPYFSGQKSVDEVADIIQSRVNIYVNENS